MKEWTTVLTPISAGGSSNLAWCLFNHHLYMLPIIASSLHQTQFIFIFLLFSSTFVRLYLIEYLLLLNMLNIHSRYFMEVSYCCSNAWRRSEFLFYNYHICVILSRKISRLIDFDDIYNRNFIFSILNLLISIWTFGMNDCFNVSILWFNWFALFERTIIAQ